MMSNKPENNNMDVHVAEPEEPMTEKRAERPPHQFELFCIGIARMMGGQVFIWNKRLTVGVYEYFGLVLIVMLLFIVVVDCLAEMSSTLPFTGGLYGYVRVILGPFFDYLCGSGEILENVTNMAGTGIYIGRIIEHIVGHRSSLVDLVVWLILLVLSSILCWKADKLLYPIISAVTILAVLVLILYFILAFFQLDYIHALHDTASLQAEKDTSVRIKEVFDNLCYSTTFFLGLEMLPVLASSYKNNNNNNNDSNNSQVVTTSSSSTVSTEIKIILPRILWSCTSFACITSILIVWLAACQSPYPVFLTGIDFPLSYDLANGLHIPLAITNLFMLPALFACFTSAMHIAVRMMTALAGSKLLPYSDLLSTSPIYILVVICIMVLILFLVISNFPAYHNRDNEFLLYISGCTSGINYSLLLICYFVFCQKHRTLPRHYRSFLGPRIVLGFWVVCFGLTVYCLLFGRKDFLYASLTVIGFVMMVGILYFCYFRSEQIFNEEEKQILFPAYLINSNLKKHQTMLKRLKTTGTRGPTSFFSYLLYWCLPASSRLYVIHSPTSATITRTSPKAVQQQVRKITVRGIMADNKIVPVDNNDNSNDDRMQTKIAIDSDRNQCLRDQQSYDEYGNDSSQYATENLNIISSGPVYGY